MELSQRPREIGFFDELLADGTVHRRYEDEHSEWRRPGEVVRWHDDRGEAGTDEPLGERIIKRTYADGRVRYGRDIGYGRTVWREGDTVLVTVNRTASARWAGPLRGALGLAPAVTAAQLPPLGLTPEEEAELRRRGRLAKNAKQDGGREAMVVVDIWDADTGGDLWDDDFG